MAWLLQYYVVERYNVTCGPGYVRVVTAVNEERRTLRVGDLAAIAVLIVAAALVLSLFYRRTQEQNTRVYAAITRLQTGVLTQTLPIVLLGYPTALDAILARAGEEIRKKKVRSIAA